VTHWGAAPGAKSAVYTCLVTVCRCSVHWRALSCLRKQWPCARLTQEVCRVLLFYTESSSRHSFGLLHYIVFGSTQHYKSLIWYDMLFFIITAFTHQSAIVTHTYTFNCPLPSVLWRCWLGGRRASGLLKTEWWGAGVVICLERGADLHMAQVMPLPLTVSCFSKIQVGLTFLVPAYPGSPGKGAVKWVCVVRDYPDGLVLER